MSSLNKYLWIVIPLFLCSFIHSQEKYPYTDANKNCILKLGKYEMPLFERKPAFIPFNELIKIDSIQTCNCDFEISKFTIVEVNQSCMDCEVNNTGSKFSKRLKTYFNSIYNYSPTTIRTFYIYDIYTIKSGWDRGGNIDIFALTTDSICRAFCFAPNSDKKFIGKINPSSKAIFLQLTSISCGITDIKSFTVEIVSKKETKIFNIMGKLISQQVKDYIWSTGSEIEIHIKNVIAGNNYGYSIKAEGISFQCKY